MTLMTPDTPLTARRRLRAFTLVEVLVVIVIIALLAAIALPAFRRILGSNEESLAEASLQLGVRMGRDAGVRAPVGSDAGVVFFFEPGGVVSMVPVVKVGEIDDTRGGPSGPLVRREVFAPTLGVEPVQLPRNWSARGYAAPGMIDVSGDWYESPNLDAYPITTGSARIQSGEANWVFPETNFIVSGGGQGSAAPASAGAGQGPNRQSFMLRFQGGTGIFMGSDPRDVLVLSPTADASWRSQSLADQWKRADQADDPARWVRRVLSDRSLTAEQRRELLGARSTDVVTVRSVAHVALYKETDLAADIGVDVDRRTRSIYLDVDYDNVRGPTLVDGAEPRAINRWILGDTNDNGVVESAGGGDEPKAKVYSIDRYRGELVRVEVQP